MISSNRWPFSLKFLGSNHLSIPRPPPNLAYKKSNQLSFLSVDNPIPCLSHQKISFIFFLKAMEFSTFHPSSWHSFFTSPLLFPYHFIPENYVHWTETPESHIYSADLPGVKKEHIRVEVEDSKYLIIRTEAINESTEPARSFVRKFQLPGMIDVNGISAGYEDGVLTVTVPRSSVRRGFFIEPSDISERLGVLARAA